MTLDQKIGQMCCFGWGGADSRARVNAQAAACVGDLHAGGMIVMGRNIGPDIAAVRATLDELQSLAAVPLLLATDQEGGRVARLRAPLTTFPSAQVIGAAGDVDLAREVARVTGVELAQAGINFNFAPVADVNSNPANPVIGDRSFESTPGAVAPFVRAQIEGYTQAGVLACAKHFPGHGDTHVDSHFDLPTVAGDLAALESRELIPFRVAITAGTPAVMTAHILFPALDPSGVPATMSRPILSGLLRQTLGFNGLIVTDCLEMKAVADRWGTARAAVLAAQAGADVLLVCHTLDRQRETFNALRAAVEGGELPIERVEDAVSRVLAAKRRLAPPPPLDLGEIGAAEHVAVARALLEKAGLALDPAFGAPTTLGAEAPV